MKDNFHKDTLFLKRENLKKDTSPILIMFVSKYKLQGRHITNFNEVFKFHYHCQEDTHNG